MSTQLNKSQLVENSQVNDEVNENFGETESSANSYEEDFNLELDSDDDIEKTQLSNLTFPQMQALINENEYSLEKCKDTIAVIEHNIQKITNDECKVLWTPSKKEELEKLEKKLREDEVHLEELKKRISFLKSIKIKHQPIPLTKLPQIVLCSPWNDTFMPMIVVCNKPRESIEEKKHLNKKLLDDLTQEQFDHIEKERRWMALEYGDLEIQIAGIKGKTKIMNKENNVLKALVFQDTPKDNQVNLTIPGTKKGVCRKKGLKNFSTCPQYEKKEKNDIPLMEITVTSVPYQQSTSNFSIPNCEHMEEDIESIKKKAEELQQAINDANGLDRTLKSQQDALKCLNEAIK